MHYLTLMVLAGLFSFSSAVTEAAPRWIEDVCFSQAAKRSFNDRGERKQFMANCIANLTESPPRERGKYKRRHRY